MRVAFLQQRVVQGPSMARLVAQWRGRRCTWVLRGTAWARQMVGAGEVAIRRGLRGTAWACQMVMMVGAGGVAMRGRRRGTAWARQVVLVVGAGVVAMRGGLLRVRVVRLRVLLGVCSLDQGSPCSGVLTVGVGMQGGRARRV